LEDKIILIYSVNNSWNYGMTNKAEKDGERSPNPAMENLSRTMYEKN